MKIKPEIIRTYQTLHSWTGILSGLLLFIGFFAGSLILFEKTIAAWATPPAQQFLGDKEQNRDLVLQQVLQQYPDAQKEVTVNLSNSAAPVVWSDTSSRELSMVSQRYSAYQNPEQELLVETDNPNQLGELIDQLHRTAGLAGEVGHEHWGAYVLGIASVLYFLALISGLIFLLPTLIKSLFALRANKTRSRFWLDTHNLLGVLSLPFHIAISLTVVVFVFHDFFYGGLIPIYGEEEMFSRPVPHTAPYEPRQLSSLQDMVNQAESQAIGYSVDHITLTNVNSKSPMARIAIYSDTDLVRGPNYDYLFIHPYTLKSFDFGNAHSENGVWAKIVKVFFAIHLGSFGGDPGRWLYFFLGLAGTVIFYTGNLLWLDKKAKKQKDNPAKSLIILAKLTVAIPLGSMLGVAIAFAITKPLTLLGIEINNAYLLSYYLCFACAIAMSFTQGHVKAAISLLKMLSAVLIAIPIISLVLHFTSLWRVNDPNYWFIEILSALFALTFVKMRQNVQRRSNTSEAWSFWGIPKDPTTYSKKIC